MILRRLAFQRMALKAGIYAAFTLSFWFAFWLRFSSGLVPVEWSVVSRDYVILYLVAVVAWGGLSRLVQLDHLWVASEPERWIKGGVWATLGTLMVVSFGAFFFRTYSFSRLFIVLIAAVNTLVLVVTLRVVLMLAQREQKQGDKIRVLIVGDSKRAEEISGVIATNSWVRCDVLGYLAANGEVHRGSVHRLGRLDDLEPVCRDYQPDEILVAVPLDQLSRVADLKRAMAVGSRPS